MRKIRIAPPPTGPGDVIDIDGIDIPRETTEALMVLGWRPPEDVDA